MRTPADQFRVVIFSGGRGSSVLSRSLITHPGVRLTVAINGYDDGASTGEVRRFLGDALGPSDFRKNASRLAGELRTCSEALLQVIDFRLPEGARAEDATRVATAIRSRGLSGIAAELDSAIGALAVDECARASERLERFLQECRSSARSFVFGDCAIGNLVFAGSFLLCGRDFNRAVDDYCATVGLPVGMLEDVTDGTNAFLVGLDVGGRVIATEEELVDPRRGAPVKDIFLVGRRLTQDEVRTLGAASDPERARFFDDHAARVALNPRVADKLQTADVIIYAPGTQYSSLFPSYLTPGLSAAIAANLRAIKLLVTNIQADAETQGTSAVDLIDRAVYYLKEKGRLGTPTPALITHYVMNDPAEVEADRPYVPLGQVDLLEDPRLVRISNYEEGVTGRHDAKRILTPFLQSLLARPEPPRIAVLLYDGDSQNKVAQTLVEMVRGGAGDLAARLTVFYGLPQALDPDFVRSLPFDVAYLGADGDAETKFRAALDDRFDYVLLFESSGMYRGEDMVSLASHLALGRLDAVWGSRRLSVRDIQQSYRLRYEHNWLLGTISYAGSHLLSLGYLLMFGRYVADTLSAVRAVRASDALAVRVPLTHKQANHHLLTGLLGRRADLLEVPVQFFPISPERVKRTTVGDGLRALGTMIAGRFGRRAG